MEEDMDKTPLVEGDILLMVVVLTKNSYMGSTPKKRCPRTLPMSLCESHNEDMEHLLNLCPFADQLWRNISQLFGHLDRDNNSIKYSIEMWRNGIFLSPILNRLGALLWVFSYGQFGKNATKGSSKRKDSPKQRYGQGSSRISEKLSYLRSGIWMIGRLSLMKQ